MNNSILEFDGKKKKINIPDYIGVISTLMNKVVENEEFCSKEMEMAYNYLQDWYEKEAIKIFKNEDLFLDGFLLLTPEMKKKGIIDYARFEKI